MSVGMRAATFLTDGFASSRCHHALTFVHDSSFSGHEEMGEGEVAQVREADEISGHVLRLGQPLQLVHLKHLPQLIDVLADHTLVAVDVIGISTQFICGPTFMMAMVCV